MFRRSLESIVLFKVQEGCEVELVENRKNGLDLIAALIKCATPKSHHRQLGEHNSHTEERPAGTAPARRVCVQAFGSFGMDLGQVERLQERDEIGKIKIFE